MNARSPLHPQQKSAPERRTITERLLTPSFMQAPPAAQYQQAGGRGDMQGRFPWQGVLRQKAGDRSTIIDTLNTKTQKELGKGKTESAYAKHLTAYQQQSGKDPLKDEFGGFARMSKRGIDFTTTKKNPSSIRFMLDNLDLDAIANKTKAKHGKSITSGELRHVFRQSMINAGQINGEPTADVSKIHFYSGGDKVAPPWATDSKQWADYLKHLQQKHGVPET